MAVSVPLFGQELAISDAFLTEIKLRKFVRLAAKKAAKRFEEAYSNKLSDMEDLVTRGWEIGYDILFEAAAVYVKYLSTYEIYSVAAQDLLEKMNGSYFAEELGILEEWYISVQKDEARKDAYRKMRRQTRSRWVGGGFGFSGNPEWL